MRSKMSFDDPTCPEKNVCFLRKKRRSRRGRKKRERISLALLQLPLGDAHALKIGFLELSEMSLSCFHVFLLEDLLLACAIRSLTSSIELIRGWRV